MIVKDFKIITIKKLGALFNKPNTIEKSKEKSMKVLHMIFLGASIVYLSLIHI